MQQSCRQMKQEGERGLVGRVSDRGGREQRDSTWWWQEEE